MPAELKKRIPGEAEVRDGDHGRTLILLEITGVQEGERRWKKGRQFKKGPLQWGGKGDLFPRTDTG